MNFNEGLGNVFVNSASLARFIFPMPKTDTVMSEKAHKPNPSDKDQKKAPHHNEVQRQGPGLDGPK